jgi:hypothetical protein
MRTLTILIILSVFLTGCGGGNRDAASVNNTVTPTATRETDLTITEMSPAPTATPSPATKTGDAPVEFTFLGVAPDKETASYKIKVKTSEPIGQVDLGVKYLKEDGTVLEETTFAWQNVVKSARQPIENGKTYEVKDYLPEGATKAEYTLKRVIFQNGTRWEAR